MRHIWTAVALLGLLTLGCTGTVEPLRVTQTDIAKEDAGVAYCLLAVALGLPEKPLARSPGPASASRVVVAATSLARAATLEASSTDVLSTKGRRPRTRWMVGALVVAASVVAFSGVRGTGAKDPSIATHASDVPGRAKSPRRSWTPSLSWSGARQACG